MKSHVLPQALHKDLQGVGEPDQAMLILGDKLAHSRKSRTGAWDRVVCADCENLFEPWDQYGVDFVRTHRSGSSGRLIGRHEDTEGLEVPGVDYARLKLFVLATLWRADACSHPPFKDFQLGEKWSGALRDAVRRSDPGSPEFFSTSVSMFRSERDQHLMFDPHRQRLGGVNYVRFYVYGGFTFLVKVDQRRAPPPFHEWRLESDRPLVLLLRDLSPGEKRAALRIVNKGH